MALYRGKFYQAGERRSPSNERVGSREGKRKGRGWSVIKKTFLTPIGAQQPPHDRRKREHRRLLNQAANSDPEIGSTNNLHKQCEADKEIEDCSFPNYSSLHQPAHSKHQQHQQHHQHAMTRSSLTPPSPILRHHDGSYPHVIPPRYQDQNPPKTLQTSRFTRRLSTIIAKFDSHISKL